MRLLPLVWLAAGCFTMRVETRSQPTTVHLRLAQCDAVLEKHVGAGEFQVVPTDDATADIDVPGMGGGYSERGGKRSNVHDPDTYEVVRLRREDKILVGLSLKQIRALPKDTGGRAMVSCGA
jgi:hypothetical protein